MAGFPTNSLRFTAVISGQIIILAFGYGFLEAVLHFEYLAPPNQVGNLWRLHPEELTMVVTLIATVLSVATTMCVCPSTLPNYFSAMSFFKFLHDFCQGSTKTSNEGSYLSIPTEYWYLFVPGLSYYATWTP
jgi:hypothetical protein